MATILDQGGRLLLRTKGIYAMILVIVCSEAQFFTQPHRPTVQLEVESLLRIQAHLSLLLVLLQTTPESVNKKQLRELQSGILHKLTPISAHKSLVSWIYVTHVPRNLCRRFLHI